MEEVKRINRGAPISDRRSYWILRGSFDTSLFWDSNMHDGAIFYFVLVDDLAQCLGLIASRIVD